MEQRFLRHINKTDTCWLWTAATRNGYGRFNHNGMKQAYRVAYELWVRPIPAGLLIRHKCRNRSCVNPDHLETGTYTDNNGLDRHRDGTMNMKGENHPKATITEDDVREIRRLRASGMMLKVIAALLTISISQVEAISNRRRWSHVV